MRFVKKNLITLIGLITALTLLSVSIFAWFTSSQNIDVEIDGNIQGDSITGNLYHYNVETSKWVLKNEPDELNDFQPGDTTYFMLDLKSKLTYEKTFNIKTLFDNVGYNSYVFDESATSYNYYIDEGKLPDVNLSYSVSEYESYLIQLFDGLKYTYYEASSSTEVPSINQTNTLYSFDSSDNKAFSGSLNDITFAANERKYIIFAIKFDDSSSSFYVKTGKEVIIDNKTFIYFRKNTTGNSNVYKDKTIYLNTFVFLD